MVLRSHFSRKIENQAKPTYWPALFSAVLSIVSEFQCTDRSLFCKDHLLHLRPAPSHCDQTMCTMCGEVRGDPQLTVYLFVQRSMTVLQPCLVSRPTARSTVSSQVADTLPPRSISINEDFLHCLITYMAFGPVLDRRWPSKRRLHAHVMPTLLID